jgi:plastocyanin
MAGPESGTRERVTGFARRALATATLLSCAIAGSVLGVAPAHAADYTVTIISASAGSQAYSPSPKTINPGDTVHWTNNDSYQHNAYCSASECPEAWSSGRAEAGPNKDVGSHTFPYSGRYIYHCVVHGNMTGEIDVTGNVHPPQPAQSSPATAGGSTPATAPAGGGQSGGGATAQRPAADSAGGNATSYGGQSAASGDHSAAQTLGGLTLPRPEVRVQTIAAASTPAWVFALTLVLAVLSAVVFGIAWFSPRRAKAEVQ